MPEKSDLRTESGAEHFFCVLFLCSLAALYFKANRARVVCGHHSLLNALRAVIKRTKRKWKPEQEERRRRKFPKSGGKAAPVALGSETIAAHNCEIAMSVSRELFAKISGGELLAIPLERRTQCAGGSARKATPGSRREEKMPKICRAISRLTRQNVQIRQ